MRIPTHAGATWEAGGEGDDALAERAIEREEGGGGRYGSCIK